MKKAKMNPVCLLSGFICVAVFAALYIVPIGVNFYYSLADSSFSGQASGLNGFLSVLRNKNFLTALGNSSVVMLLTVGGGMILSGLIAFLLFQYGSRVYFSLAVLNLPLFIPSCAVTALWQFVFKTSAFCSDGTAYTALLTLFFWKYSGIGATILYIGAKSMDRSVSEAAEVDGAGNARKFLCIMLPNLIGYILVSLAGLLMYFLQLHKECYLLFGAYPCTCMYQIQHYISNNFNKLNYRNAAAGSVMITIFSVTVCLILFAVIKRRAGEKQ